MTVDPQLLEELCQPGRTLDVIGPQLDALGTRYSGKVRENYSLEGVRTIVVTDRVSAFDVVLGTIPLKGQVLNRLASWWFERTASIFANHVLSVPDAQVTRAVECEAIPVEFVVRSYLTGVTSTSIWRAYERGERSFCGHSLPEGLRKHERLTAPLLTPSTKAAKGGHDESVSRDELLARGLIDDATFSMLEIRCLALFAQGQRMAAERGLILVDTKYELGRRPDGEIVLIDEVHTPDSSRYWYADGYDDSMRAGTDPRSLDKEYLRRWYASQGYTGDGAPPPLTDEVRVGAAQRYIETFELLTGTEFEPALGDPIPRICAALQVG